MEEIEVSFMGLIRQIISRIGGKKISKWQFPSFCFFRSLLPALGLLLSLDFAFAVDFPIGNFGIVVILYFTELDKVFGSHVHLI